MIVLGTKHLYVIYELAYVFGNSKKKKLSYVPRNAPHMIELVQKLI